MSGRDLPDRTWSYLHTDSGAATVSSSGVTFPRILGIEAVGVVDAAPGSDLQPGQQVATLMGGMGRVFDGGYAEYTVVPRQQVIPFTSTLPACAGRPGRS